VADTLGCCRESTFDWLGFFQRYYLSFFRCVHRWRSGLRLCLGIVLDVSQLSLDLLRAARSYATVLGGGGVAALQLFSSYSQLAGARTGRLPIRAGSWQNLVVVLQAAKKAAVAARRRRRDECRCTQPTHWAYCGRMRSCQYHACGSEDCFDHFSQSTLLSRRICLLPRPFCIAASCVGDEMGRGGGGTACPVK
jgi:hypothetical protein